MEQVEVHLPIPGSDLAIYGRYSEMPGAPVVVYLHGLHGSVDSVLSVLFTKRLAATGYSSFTFNQYSYQDDARKQTSITFADHVDDTNTVIAYLRSTDSKRPIVLVGHSWGALVLLLRGSEGLAAGILWDPSDDAWTSGRSPDGKQWLEQFNAYVVSSSFDFLIGKPMLDHLATMKPFELASQFKAPAFIGAAGGGTLVKSAEIYAEMIDNSELVVIEGANHNFTIGDRSEELLDRTLAWLATVAPPAPPRVQP